MSCCFMDAAKEQHLKALQPHILFFTQNIKTVLMFRIMVCEQHMGLFCMLSRKHLLIAQHDIHSSLGNHCTVAALAVLGWHQQALDVIRAMPDTGDFGKLWSSTQELHNYVVRDYKSFNLLLRVVLSDKIGNAPLNST